MSRRPRSNMAGMTQPFSLNKILMKKCKIFLQYDLVFLQETE